MKFYKGSECELSASYRIRWNESETIRALVMETKEESRNKHSFVRACICEEGTRIPFNGKRTTAPLLSLKE